jgi:peptidylprolyl isomerase
LYLELQHGTVVMELAPQFAPMHISNLRKLVRGDYFNGAAIIRAQDNYVVQWSNPSFDEGARLPGGAASHLQPEFFRAAKGLHFEQLDSRDAYAAETGFSDGFPVGRDGQAGRAWLAHCYGMLGAGRANEPDSGNAAELYVVTGHAPRHLDRNVTLLGRVIDGIEHLSSLPRGTGPLGFYEKENQYVAIKTLRFAADADPKWQVLKTDTATFRALVATRRHRSEEWFVDPADAIGLCNVPLPVRVKPSGGD